jgi:hypothetical protein
MNWRHDGWGPDHFGPGVFGPGGHELAALFFLGTTLLWIVAPLALTALYLWWRRRQARPLLAGEAGAPSAFEQLRRRYVVGEIDVATFEEMTGRLLLSEHAEYSGQGETSLLAGYEAYQRREREGGGPAVVWV